MENKGTLGSIKSSFSRGLTSISVKTSSSLEKSKLNMQIDNIKKEITILYGKAGQGAYSLWNVGDDFSQELEENFKVIKQKKEQIQELEEKIIEIEEENKKILGGVRAEIDQAENVVMICSQCSSEYNTMIKFCVKCGNSMS